MAELLKHMRVDFKEQQQDIKDSILEKTAGVLVFILGGITLAEVF